MPDSATRSAADEDDWLERDILTLLGRPSSSGLWAATDICRALGGELMVTDALDRLQRSGIVHRCGDFVLITHAAARSLQLAEL